jgi:membrane protein DedA with SNARE-associated domain
MGVIALIGLGIIGGAAWQSDMDSKRWFIAIVGAIIFLVLLIGGITETFKDED